MKKLILLFFVVICGSNWSQNNVLHNFKLEPVSGTKIEYYEDKTNRLTANDVLSRPFEKSNMVTPNFGVSSSTFWVRFNLTNQYHDQILLKLAYANLDEIELYRIKDSIYLLRSFGKSKIFAHRDYNDPAFIFNLNLKKNQTGTYLIKVKSGGQIILPLYTGTKENVLESTRRENLFVGIYIGLMMIMFFYNLFIYFTIRDHVYLYYVAYILIVCFVQLCLLGYTFQFFWPQSTWLAQHSLYILSALVGLSSIAFVKRFLNTKEKTPRLHKGFHIISSVYVLYIVLDLFNLSAPLYNVIQGCAMILSLYMLFVANRIRKRGNRSASFFLLAWTIFLAGVFVFALKDIGILPYNSYTVYLMPIGSAFEAALLSFALADKINILRKEKEESQQKSLELLKENTRIIQEQSAILETKVKERTLELEESNKNLKEAEAHLVNVEKMASLGQLTAGISHEINNPINFVITSITPLRRDIEDILLILKKYGELQDDENFSAKLKEIDKLKDQLELDELTEEINLLLKGITEGANRTAEIVKGLKNFARTDEEVIKSFDVHDGINTTLSILSSNISSAKIAVEKHFENIPNIQCNPGKINQVFMNVLSNAIDAITARHYKNKEGKIEIFTKLSGSNIEIKVRDNGTGIPKNILAKVFDPFFTTKDVGEGTGLGLSIVYGIIKAHNGEVIVESEENKGTDFIFKLPVQYSSVQ